MSAAEVARTGAGAAKTAGSRIARMVVTTFMVMVVFCEVLVGRCEGKD